MDSIRLEAKEIGKGSFGFIIPSYFVKELDIRKGKQFIINIKEAQQ